MSKKKRSLRTVKREADRVFSRLVRRSHTDKRGYVYCITCERKMLWNHGSCHAGHFRSRRHNATRYDRRNVHPQCDRCNTFANGEQYIYGQKIAQKYGQGAPDDLLALSREIKQWTVDELEQLIASWRQELKDLGDPFWNK